MIAEWIHTCRWRHALLTHTPRGCIHRRNQIRQVRNLQGRHENKQICPFSNTYRNSNRSLDKMIQLSDQTFFSNLVQLCYRSLCSQLRLAGRTRTKFDSTVPKRNRTKTPSFGRKTAAWHCHRHCNMSFACWNHSSRWKRCWLQSANRDCLWTSYRPPCLATNETNKQNTRRPVRVIRISSSSVTQRNSSYPTGQICSDRAPNRWWQLLRSVGVGSECVRFRKPRRSLIFWGEKHTFNINERSIKPFSEETLQVQEPIVTRTYVRFTAS